MDNVKIPLPNFLKLFTDNNVPVSTAMTVARKIYTEYNTPAQLRALTELKLTAAGIEDKSSRSLVLAALRNAGYAPKRVPLKRKQGDDEQQQQLLVAGSSTPAYHQSSPTKRSRKHRDVNEFLPKEPQDEVASYGSLEFNETMDEHILRNKLTIVNRAPVMMAWATVVAERLGFKREEALSIAVVYTEMNAITKGVSLGIYHDKQSIQRGKDAEKGGEQPYVDLMGRRVYAHDQLSATPRLTNISCRPLYKTQSDQWRAISDGTPASPGQSFSYISRSFRQTTPHVIGAMKLLAESYPPDELNNRAWSLYTQFRPSVDAWGKKAEMRCDNILNLRRASRTNNSTYHLHASEMVHHTPNSESFEKSQSPQPDHG
ncbi:hypothetical protein AX17_001259 [Amanita inopinata Kibby_2008]|nr:hypothetical protein AX17_001259 [Amanita inopinata Kibby_2008]